MLVLFFLNDFIFNGSVLKINFINENAKEKIVDAVHMIEKQTCSYATNLMTESPSSDDEIIKVISNVSNPNHEVHSI